ncbi:hypothetical protein RM533_04755 [Croceicoccus sp. F390]|uniref:Uncharacterized protein n=1 Tax=Croceicoccus esteveae TaxID=3075597 RepID=A0ABU2ZFV5_9SPHN|nr:hypothetical protein [Croceicoccus sp. F390]MDT0575487.1 hypothetical protein [Croceicoccus sp. F390]
MGSTVEFRCVASKPVMVASRQDQLIVGLPGNSVFCFVIAMLFALPCRAQCWRQDRPIPVLDSQNSGALLPLALADALIVRASHWPKRAAGEKIAIHRI